eukprot:TRINITY_DN10393_c0_g1_i5.p1 TRINITY_DN10393_c0_g1~~TRINITY_DN10393_c0_g1_i5.p1  ORF type:complete len:242 (-),score=34.43 TRINITY_DN10393_c0_g1_i5:76-801(-)
MAHDGRCPSCPILLSVDEKFEMSQLNIFPSFGFSCSQRRNYYELHLDECSNGLLPSSLKDIILDFNESEVKLHETFHLLVMSMKRELTPITRTVVEIIKESRNRCITYVMLCNRKSKRFFPFDVGPFRNGNLRHMSEYEQLSDDLSSVVVSFDVLSPSHFIIAMRDPLSNQPIRIRGYFPKEYPLVPPELWMRNGIDYKEHVSSEEDGFKKVQDLCPFGLWSPAYCLARVIPHLLESLRGA